MKNFVSKLALACVAMTGLFTSCVVEDIKTAFEVAPAQAVITVNVMAGQDNVSGQATISTSAAGAAVSGNVITITGPKHLDAQTVSISASWNGATGSTDVVINKILAGGKGVYTATIILPVVEDNYSYSAVLVDSSSESTVAYLTENAHGHTADADNWLANDSEFILTGVVDYTEYVGTEVLNDEASEDKASEIIDAAKAAANYSETPATLDITVSAYAKYQVWVTRTVATEKYNVVKTNLTTKEETVVGSYDQISYSTTIEYAEAAVNGHNSHLYEEGHGSTSHGNENAGGGIVFAD